MRLTIAYSKINKRNLVLINNDTHQRETLSERPIRPPLSLPETHTCKSMILVRMQPFCFYANLVYKPKQNSQEMTFIYSPCQNMI